MQTAVLISIYLVPGFYSFIYWWTKDYDFTTDDVWFSLFTSLFGPFAFIIGWTTHGKKFGKKTLIRKKGG